MTDPTFGYGNQAPSDSATLANVIQFFILQELTRLATMRVVQVKAVNAGEGNPPAVGSVDVQPMVNQIDGNNNATEHGTVFGIPVLRFGAGKAQIIADPKVGDIGIMMCSDRDISAVKESKKISNPGSRRKFDLADGVYIGSILSEEPDQYIQFKDDGGFKIADKFGNVLETSAAGWVFTGNVTVNGNFAFGGPGNQITGNITMAGNLNVQEVAASKVQAGNIDLETHRHSGVTTGGGNSGGPIP